MSAVSEQEILGALGSVIDPDLGRDIVALGFVKGVAIDGGRVHIRVELTTPACPVKEQLRDAVAAAARAVRGVTDVTVEMTARVQPPRATQDLAPGIKHIVAVASGKGGVGKSTVAVNLAVALAQTGASVGLLDADIYGPTVPLLLGATDEPEYDGEKLLPLRRHGVSLMSMGLFLDADRALVWRGPMIGKALQQFLGDVDWGELDYLIVDLPPGTGDAPMSLAQLIPLTGVVIVMTPQDVARQIANKAIAMFAMLAESTERSLPILGVVENMSGYACPKCGEVTNVFGAGAGQDTARALGVEFLGAVPIDPNISLSGDSGQPAILADPSSPQAEAFRAIAGRVAAAISTQMLGREAGTASAAD